MTYLIDVNVLSEPTKPAPNPRVLQWLAANEAELVVDSVVLGEIYLGILRLPRGRKRVQLERWFADVVQRIACLPWDATVSLRWARLVADLQNQGYRMPLLDSMIAATALAHDLTLVTGIVRDFKRTGVKLLNPFR